MKLKPSKNDITGDIVKEVLENHKILATALVAGEELQVDEIRYLINNYNVLTKPQTGITTSSCGLEVTTVQSLAITVKKFSLR